MRGAARAIGWELMRHHRLGIILVAAYLVGFWVVKAWVLPPEMKIRLGPPNGLAAFLIAPFSFTYIFLVGIFSYGLSGDLASRESRFPQRMLTLPISTRALAGWPMFYGTASVAALWTLLAALTRWPGGADLELAWVWPALMMAVFLAWMQALTWFAYPMRGMRIVVAVVLLTAVDAGVLLAVAFKASQAVMVAILAPALLLAYVAGYRAILQARRGHIPNWQMGSRGTAASASPFRSARRAQAWLEWRQHGRTLPALVFFVVPVEMLLLFIPGNQTPGIILAVLLVVLVTPPGMALLASPALASFSTRSATRPLTSVALVAAKLEMTLWSTLAAWGVAFVFAAGGLWLSGSMPVVVEELTQFHELGGVRAMILVLGIVALAMVATWKNLVQSLCIGLSGSPWVIRVSVLLAFALIIGFFPVVWTLLRNDRVQAAVWDWLPWILAGLVVLKVTAASWVAVKLHDRGVLGDCALVAAAMTWLVVVALLYGALTWLADSPAFPAYFVGALAILIVPLARLSAAPLALAGNRHR